MGSLAHQVITCIEIHWQIVFGNDTYRSVDDRVQVLSARVVMVGIRLEWFSHGI